MSVATEKMSAGVYLTYSDLFDRKPTTDELLELIKTIPLRHAIHAVSRINLGLRYAMQELGAPNFAEVQCFFMAAHCDDEVLWLLKRRFPFARCDERPIFLPHGLLNVLRLIIMHSDPQPPVDLSVDEPIRYAIGRACLMMNDLFLNEAEHDALFVGTQDDRRIALMVQMLAGYEIANPPKPHHVMPRMHVMFRALLKDETVRTRIAKRCNGFDVDVEFTKAVGMPLERWLFVVFSIYSYFLNCGDARDPNPEYMIVNPEKFRGDSGISKEEFEIVLGTIATPMTELRVVMSNETTDPRYDFVSFRSKPLFTVEEGRILPADLAFPVEKCHAGVHWTIHDKLQSDRRELLFNAWGVLFEEYVHCDRAFRFRDLYRRKPHRGTRRSHENKLPGADPSEFDQCTVSCGVLHPDSCSLYVRKVWRYRCQFVSRHNRLLAQDLIVNHRITRNGADAFSDESRINAGTYSRHPAHSFITQTCRELRLLIILTAKVHTLGPVEAYRRDVHGDLSLTARYGNDRNGVRRFTEP